MVVCLFGNIPGGFLDGNRLQQGTVAKCCGARLLRAGHEARRRGRRLFENEGIVVRGWELKKNSYRPPGQRRLLAAQGADRALRYVEETARSIHKALEGRLL